MPDGTALITRKPIAGGVGSLPLGFYRPGGGHQLVVDAAVAAGLPVRRQRGSRPVRRHRAQPETSPGG